MTEQHFSIQALSNELINLTDAILEDSLEDSYKYEHDFTIKFIEGTASISGDVIFKRNPRSGDLKSFEFDLDPNKSFLTFDGIKSELSPEEINSICKELEY